MEGEIPMRKRAIIAAVAAVLLAGPATAGAQVHFGGQLSFGSDQDLGLGARLLANVTSLEHWDFIGTFDWFFPDEPVGQDRTYWEVNGNLAYNFNIQSAPSISPYVGGGLNIAHLSKEFEDGRDSSDTDLGINLLAGTQFGTKAVTPFVELRVELAGGEQFVITGGLLF
jgi:opacity protein-like surface antigen